MVKKVEIESGGDKFDAEVAESILAKSIGLSFRSSGKMLFSFTGLGRPPIDMMLVPEPLNLYFLDEDKQVVDVQYAEPWGLNPRTWRIYRPEQNSKFLLESFEDLDLEEGDTLEFCL